MVGFDLPLPNGHGFPDFTDCPTNTVEPSERLDRRRAPGRTGARPRPAHAGVRRRPVRGPDRARRQHLWTFCRDRRWPRGDLNLPRALFTEKAFPENETLFSDRGAPRRRRRPSQETVIYEQRFGARGTYEVSVPVGAQQAAPGGPWHRGLGDIELTVRQTVHADHERGTIVAVGGAVTLPTGKETLGLGNGYTVYEPLLLAGQMLGANGFVQMQAGYEIASSQEKGTNEAFLRTAVGLHLGAGRGVRPRLDADGGGAGGEAVGRARPNGMSRRRSRCRSASSSTCCSTPASGCR